MPDADRLAFWVEAVCETFLELQVDSAAGHAFRGSVEICRVGPLAMNFLRSDDQHIVRSRQAISRGKLSEFYLIQPRDTTIRMEQLGREIELRPGGCTLIDSRYPFRIENARDQNTLSIAIPTNWLLTWVPCAEELLAQAWMPGVGWGGVLAQAVGNLTPEQIETLPIPASVFCDQLGALMALAGAEASVATVPSARSSVVDRLRDTIRSEFRNLDLSPAEVARHNGVSLRYLHVQFARMGTSFGEELLTVRLSHAHQMLEDPRYDRLSVGEIALRCGFANASHFARRYRGRFGRSPTRTRALCRT
ncbi:MAG: AraC family transcriptional regulator [Janthinobacterium lividum]